MACGPITLTPQMLSTAMAFFGQNPALPQDLSLVMRGVQPEMKLEVQCDGTGKATGFTLERYFDTKSATTVVVPLDDGEVDEQTSYAHSAADGRVAQKLTVRLDSDYKLASYGVEALCSGTNPNPNAPVCMTHVPTVNGFMLPNHKGQHADWMQTFIPEVMAGAEYLFVPTAEYETEKKKIDDQRKANATPPPTPSASATVTAPPAATAVVTAPPVTTGQPVPPPANSAPPPKSTPTADTKNSGPSPFDIGAVALALLGVGGFLASRFAGKKKAGEEDKSKSKARPNAHPDVKKAIKDQVEDVEDEGIPSPRKKATTELSPPAKTKSVKTKTPTPPPSDDDDEMGDVLKDLEDAKKNQTPEGSPPPPMPSKSSPVPPKPSGASANKKITPDNVIIKGSHAEPVAQISQDIIRNQVLLYYRDFLAPESLQTLLIGEHLADGSSFINDEFEAELDEVVTAIILKYKEMEKKESEALKNFWDAELADRGSIVRRGVPERLLIGEVNAFLQEHAKSAKSPFAGGVAKKMMETAARESGERRFIENGMRELVRFGG